MTPKIDIIIKDKSLHQNLLILKATLYHKKLENTIQYLYNFYKTFGDKSSYYVPIEQIIRDLKEVKQISHPKHTEEVLKKYVELKEANKDDS